MKDTEASLRKEWNDLFDRIMALGTAKGQKNAAQELNKVVRDLQSTATEPAAVPAPKAKGSKSKKRLAVKQYVEKALKDNAGSRTGMTPPDIRDYAKKHFSKDLRTESIRQALIRMSEYGEAHKRGRHWYFGSGFITVPPAEAADSGHSAGSAQFSGG